MDVDMCSDMQWRTTTLEALALPYKKQVTGHSER